MYYCLIILGVLFSLELVTANPLMQSIPSWPLHTPTHYQQNVYQPYSEAFILQPNNIIPYPQQFEVLNPLSYQPIQEVLLQDHTHQFYWDKLLSNPTFKSIIDVQNSMNSKDANEMQIISRNPCIGDIINNYIIIPPEYFDINKTAHKQTDKRVKNNLKDSKKDSNARSSRKKKVFNKSNIEEDVLLNNLETKSGKKYLNTVPVSFDASNIKCYTSAEVLEDVNSKMKKKHEKNKERNKSNTKNETKSAELSKTCANNEEHIKLGKSKQKKAKKKWSESKNKDNTNKVMECTKTTKKKKNKLREIDSNNCGENIKPPKIHCETKTIDKFSENCDLNIGDLFNLNQDCIDLENRRTRNSKNDAATKDFCNIYSYLPDDITRNYAWYMDDLFSNPMVANTDFNLFSGNNMYSYDLNQFYKMPQYSNTDVNKTSGNKARSRKTKKKKKQKGKNSTKNKNEPNIDAEKDANVPKRPMKMETKKATNIQTPRIDQFESIENTTKLNKENLTIIVDTLSNEKIKEKVKLIEEPVEPMQLTDIMKIYDINEKEISTKTPIGEQMMKEIFETQIPESVNTHKSNEYNADELQNKEKTYDESQFVADSYEFEQTPEIELEEQLPYILDYRLVEDYYPDFTKDNLAYLVSSEESDVQNIHDRYFYTTDRNIESQESYRNMPVQISASKDRISYKDNETEKDKLVQINADKNRAKLNRELEEIVFRTPPGLDFPDFITRKINRNRQDSSEYFYQHNNDDEYDRFNFDNSADNSDLYLKTTGKFAKPDLKSENVVETVYARSKVVKYGQSQVSEKTLKPKTSSHFVDVPEGTFQKDKEKTIIIAKSLDPNDNW